jgi:foldase protein PrsA
VLELVAATLAVALAGGPGDAVVTVDGDPIEKRTFDHWFEVAARSAGGRRPVVPRPPRFTECIAAKRRTAPRKPRPIDAQLKRQCRQDYENMRKQALQLLINAKWIEHEAAELGIAVSDEEVRRSFESQKGQAFPKERDYREFLRQSGRSEADILFQVRNELLSNKIRDLVHLGAEPVSDTQIADYYSRHRKRFADPERRDLRIVLTKRRGEAQRAKRALRAGRSWREVARRYSIDRHSKRRGGRLPAVTKGAHEKPLDEAVFKARKGQLVGPVRTRLGYYVFEITKITPARQRSLEEAAPTIRALLEDENRQRAMDAYVKLFKAKWQARTECRRGYVVAECG